MTAKEPLERTLVSTMICFMMIWSEAAMRRRLYFLFPDEPQARRVVDELTRAGVMKKHIHAHAREGIELTSLPLATQRQKQDACCSIEKLLLNGNLLVFGIALLALLISLFFGFSVWSVLALAVMVTTFVAGALFAVKVPQVHLDEFKDALSHGEILLMIDVPSLRVAEVEDLVSRIQPEAVKGARSGNGISTGPRPAP